MVKAYKVYGMCGHRNRYSFFDSETLAFDGKILTVLCSDVTGKNDYVSCIVYCDTPENCDHFILAQRDDGLFENCRTGGVFEILPDGTEKLVNY